MTEKLSFDDLYLTPQAREWAYQHNMLYRTQKIYACTQCKQDTLWVDYMWGVAVPTCGPECQDAGWNEYFEATRNTNEAE